MRKHPWELPMVFLCTMAPLVLTVALLAGIESAWMLLLTPLPIWLYHGLIYARQRVNGVRVTPQRFPEAYVMLTEAARAFGLRKVPEARVIPGNGSMNPYTAGHGLRRFAAFHSDLFEAGGRLSDPEAFRFALGHEVGHIAAGHAGHLRRFLMIGAKTVPVLGHALCRAQEYTADTYGYALTQSGSHGSPVLAAGKYLYPQVKVNFDQMADRGRTERGIVVFVANALASHPVSDKRLSALRDRSRPGRMFF
jgi:Zn-dependent protease with chaperone function